MDNNDDQLLSRAHELNLLRRYDEALRLLAILAATHPHSAAVHCERAFAHHGLGRLAEALDAATLAARAAPEWEWPHRLRAIVLLACHRRREAVAAAQVAATLAPQLPEPLSVLAEAQAATGQLNAAHATAYELARIAPTLALAHTTMGRVAMARGDWRLAEQANREALRLDPQDWAAMNNLGVALERQGRRQDALEVYQEAARLDPSNEVARRNIVALVRPASGRGCLADAAMAVVAPLAVPVLVGRYLARLIRSWRLRGELRQGARLYYERAVWGGGAIRWDVAAAAAAVFGAGYVGLAIAQGLGWRLVETGMPVTALAVACGAAAVTPTVAWVARRAWTRLRPP